VFVTSLVEFFRNIKARDLATFTDGHGKNVFSKK
jgi:hypothetical protein